MMRPWALAISCIAAALVMSALPFVGASNYTITLVYYVAYFIALGQAWNFMSGFTGYVSFAHGAFAAIGAYTAILAINAGVPLIIAVAVASIPAAVASLLIGATSLRLRGIAFAFSTLFFQEIAALVVKKLKFTGGSAGIVLNDILPIVQPYLAMVVMALVLTIAIIVVRATVGVRLLAIKDDETAAVASGVPTNKFKLLLFLASAGTAGAVGGIHGVFSASLYPEVVFSIDISLIALAVPLIGGAATAMGPVLGAVLYVAVREFLQVTAPSMSVTITGLLILLCILFIPEGCIGGLNRLADRWRSR